MTEKGYEARKNELIDLLSKLQHRLMTFQYEQRLDDATQLKTDIEDDHIVVATVGEFNNGKSTFVNALLGEPLVPMGITPTTATINMLVYGEQRELFVHMQDGTIESLPLQEDVLEQYAAEGSGSPERIQYLKLALPSPMLKNRIVLIDTPGVNDLNTTRSSITYSLIPRADIVLFMLNMTSPVRRTEYEFLTETLLKQGLDRILFIANYADIADESEDQVLESIRRRLSSVEGLKEADIVPLSAREALEGRRKQDQELIGLSGIEEVERRMLAMIEHGSRGEEKLARYGARISRLMNEVAGEIERHLTLCGQTEEELMHGLDQLEDWNRRLPEIEGQVEAYVSERQAELKLMLDKSIDYLFEHVTREIEESILIYNGTDIGHYFQTHIPLLIKRRLKTWIDHNSEKIDDLLRKLEVEISKGLSEAFEQSVEIRRMPTAGLEYDEQPIMQAPQLDDPMVKSGLLVGGAGALAMVFGAPIFIPIIGMAGLPYIQKKMLKHQLDQVKPKLLLEAGNHLRDIQESFAEWVEAYAARSIRAIQRDALEQIKQRARAYSALLDRERMSKHQGIEMNRDLQNELHQFLAEINEYRQIEFQTKEG